MPKTAKQIDQMRESMGAAAANEIIRKAMAGEPGFFYAEENGLTFGTKDTRATSVIMWDERGRAYRSDPEWMIDALRFAESIGIEIQRQDMTDPDEARQVAVRLRQILAGVNNGN